MADTGYLQLKIRELNETINILESKLSNITLEINNINSKKEEITNMLKRIENLKDSIMQNSKSIDYVAEQNQKALNIAMGRFTTEVRDMIDNIVNIVLERDLLPQIREYQLDMAQTHMDGVINVINTIILELNKKQNLNIPTHPYVVVMNNKEIALKWKRKADKKLAKRILKEEQRRDIDLKR
jgi:hypothetical protein